MPQAASTTLEAEGLILKVSALPVGVLHGVRKLWRPDRYALPDIGTRIWMCLSGRTRVVYYQGVLWVCGRGQNCGRFVKFVVHVPRP